MRIDCVRTRIPAELSRGWAEKSMRGLRNMLAQTEAVRRIMPAWAMTAVPGEMLALILDDFSTDLTYDKVVVQRLSLLLCCIAGSSKKRLVFSSRVVWNSSSRSHGCFEVADDIGVVVCHGSTVVGCKVTDLV
jgi:hypothetical protein